MAESEATICSDALTLLRAQPITALNEQNPRALLCRQHYPNSRDEMLGRVPWREARKRVDLALSATIPLFGWSAYFATPPDCIWVWRTSLDIEEGGDGSINWAMENGFVATTVSALKALYIYRLTDTKQFSSLLSKAITYDLAAKLAYPLTNSGAAQEQWAKERDQVIRTAGARNGSIGTKDRYKSTTLTRD